MLFLSVAIPLISAIVIYALGAISPRVGSRLSDILANLATGALLAISVIWIIYQRNHGPLISFSGGWRPPLGINVVLDGLSTFILLTISLISFLVTLYSVDYMKGFTSKVKYYTLLLFMIGGMNGVALTGDMFNLYVFLEVAAIASYGLVAFTTEHESLEAAFKYMVLGGIASVFILFSIAVMYAYTGHLNMAYVSQAIAANEPKTLILFCSALFIFGFGLKAAMVPFHTWLPDAHPSAPAPISAMLSGVLIKVLGAYTLIRVFVNIFGVTKFTSSLLLVFGTISLLIGVLLQLGQSDLKRLLAYCSISQMGYVIIGIGLGTPLGFLGAIFHLINHATFKSLLFLNSGAIELQTGSRRIDELGGLKRKMPITSITSLIGSLAASGIPPFNGFFSKLILLVATIQARQYFIAGVVCLTAILTLVSFIRLQKDVFWGSLKERFSHITEAPGLMCTSMIVLSVFCIVLSLLLLAQFRDILLGPAVQVLLSGTGYAASVIGR